MGINKSKDAAAVLITIPVIAVILFCICAWPYNLYKLTQCDFENDLKCEILHSIGVVMPPAALITVWFETDED